MNANGGSSQGEINEFALRVNKQRRRRERRDSFGEAMSFHVAPLNPVSGTWKFPGVMSGAPVEVRPRDWLYRRDHRITIWSELVPAALVSPHSSIRVEQSLSLLA